MQSMKIITDDRCLGYHRPGDPERPDRVGQTQARLRAQTELALTWIEPEPAADELLLLGHTEAHLRRLQIEHDFDADTPYHPGILDYARRSVGGALAAQACARRGELAFSLLRPPGHHALPQRAMGFCYLNSIAIAALAARSQGVARVAIFDFDVHHGNGTEGILLDQPGVAFYSVHQSPAYPGTGLEDVGDNCFNFPVPPDTPRLEYRAVLDAALRRLQEFQPDLVGVSAGFDAYKRDPLAEELFEIEDFHWLGQAIRQLGVPTFSVLEGGYSKDLPELVFAYLKGWSGQ
jgi:acetoin utilization deacetylase AcuC-like enzyme